MCDHRRGHYYRIPFERGTGYHVAEHCSTCGVNVRGPGVWVPRRELDDPDALPVWSGRREDQPSLFE
jgi:hypothetical protein